MPPSNPGFDDLPFSKLLERIGREGPPTMQLDDLVGAFGERGFGALMLLLGLLSMTLGVIPGVTTILAVPIFLLGFQLLIWREQPWLPKRLLNRSIARADFYASYLKVKRPLEFIERYSRPRFAALSSNLHESMMGLACMVMALILVLPLIGFNLFPSIAVALFGFGMMQRDGAVMIGAWLVSIGFWIFCWLAWATVSLTLTHLWESAVGLLS
jgi:Uncharacterized ABC-type transport system, permease components